MYKKERQIYIMEKVNKDGRAITNDLTAELNVAEDTIRKDFQELASKGLVRRIHGGILKIENDLLDFDKRISINLSAKKNLAKYATALVVDYSVLYLDSGTTNLCFAESLPADFKGTIITNSPQIALACCNKRYARINLLGGELDLTTKVIKGSSTLKQLEHINIECCILGVSSLDTKAGITVPSFDESILKKQLIMQSKHIIAIATKEKLNTIATYYIADASSITHLVTDETDDNILRDYRDNGINIVIPDSL